MSSRFVPVDLAHASRLVNHGPTVLVTSGHAGRSNIMAAAWSMPVEFTPPRIAIVIDKKTRTRELVAASGGFGICIPGSALVDLTYARHTEDAYDTCFGEVVAAAADSRIFQRGHWDFRPDNAELQTIHHLGGGLFVVPGGTRRAAALP